MATKKATPEQGAEKIDKRRNTAYRDENGVRKQSYRRFKEGADYEDIDAITSNALCELMRIGIFGEEIKTEGGEVVRVARPLKFNNEKELQDAISRYITYIQDKNDQGAKLIPDVEGLACFLGINRTTLKEWENNNSKPFSNTIKVTMNALAAYKKQLGMSGKIPPIVFATDFNNNHGYTQQHNIEIQTAKKLDELPTKEDIQRRLPPLNSAIDADIDEDL